MTIYVSTGGYKNENINNVLKKMEKKNIFNLELSGGQYIKNIEKLLKSKKKFNFQIHNYFPVPKIPFVLNLASNDKFISMLTIKHVKNSIRLASKIGAKYYSIHAGFLCDLKPSDLGKKIKKKKLNNRKKSVSLFLKNVKIVSDYAKKFSIKIMIENNVITINNLKEFGKNPLLMCDPKECLKLLKKFPDNVRMVLDVGHLNVSAKTLGFERKDMFLKCNKYIQGYHLSDNNSISDSNNAFNNKSWFWNYLNKNLDYYSIEVYKENEQKLSNLMKIVSSKINV